MTNRRQFLALLGLSCLPAKLVAAAHPWPEQQIKLLNTHTGERCTATFFADGQWQPEGLQAINRLLRDHRANQACAMDPGLIALLARVQQRLNHRGEIHIISGYRSPATNEKLRANGHRVATNSLHMQGKAIDLRIPGVPLRNLQRAALLEKGGGVGFYGGDNFVHLDTGKVRHWG